MAGAVKALFRPHYTQKVAVDGVSFTVEPGEMVGYIGVNGAGKSTTIKMLTGILAPSAGSVRVLGRDPQRERVANARQRLVGARGAPGAGMGGAGGSDPLVLGCLSSVVVRLAALQQHEFLMIYKMNHV